MFILLLLLFCSWRFRLGFCSRNGDHMTTDGLALGSIPSPLQEPQAIKSTKPLEVFSHCRVFNFIRQPLNLDPPPLHSRIWLKSLEPFHQASTLSHCTSSSHHVSSHFDLISEVPKPRSFITHRAISTSKAHSSISHTSHHAAPTHSY